MCVIVDSDENFTMIMISITCEESAISVKKTVYRFFVTQGGTHLLGYKEANALGFPRLV